MVGMFNAESSQKPWYIPTRRFFRPKGNLCSHLGRGGDWSQGVHWSTLCCILAPSLVAMNFHRFVKMHVRVSNKSLNSCSSVNCVLVWFLSHILNWRRCQRPERPPRLRPPPTSFMQKGGSRGLRPRQPCGAPEARAVEACNTGVNFLIFQSCLGEGRITSRYYAPCQGKIRCDSFIKSNLSRFYEWVAGIFAQQPAYYY